MDKRVIFLMSAVFGVMALTSCAAEPPVVVVPSAPVNVLDATLYHPAFSPPNCHLQGQVWVKTADRTKPVDLALTSQEMAELQNKTAQLNGNTAVIRQNQLVHTNEGIYLHEVNADAYTCY
jgi:hypothetical protein